MIRRDDAGQRLDRFLRKLLPGSPLGNIFKLLRKGVVRVNDRRAEGDLRLAEGDRVSLRMSDAALDEFAPSAEFRALRRAGTDVPGPGAPSAPSAPRAQNAPGAPRTPVRSERPTPAAPAPVRSRRLRMPELSILHRDEHVLAVDKPPFVLVQPGEDAGQGEPTLDAMVLDVVGRGDALTFHPSLAHRLDRGTSGIVLFGMSAAGLRGLTEMFRKREVGKHYLALVAGNPEKDEFTVDLPLARDLSDDTRGAKVKVSRGAGAQEAVTDFEVLGRNAKLGFALLEARPRTGRTHQIRAHLRAVRLPIVGDPTYGDPRRNPDWAKQPGLRRQFLHAWRVRLPHPVDAGRTLEIEAPLPDDLRRALAWAGLGGSLPRA